MLRKVRQPAHPVLIHAAFERKLRIARKNSSHNGESGDFGEL